MNVLFIVCFNVYFVVSMYYFKLYFMIVAVANQKGGVGKTTLAFHLGLALSEEGRRVLLVDADPQMNLTKTLSRTLDLEQIDPSSRLENLFKGGEVVPAGKENLWMVSSSRKLAEFDVSTTADSVKERIELMDEFASAMDGKFDAVIIDTPPNLGILTTASLIASHLVLVPFDSSEYSLDGIESLGKILKIYSRLTDARIGKLVPFDIPTKTRMAGGILDVAKERYGKLVYDFVFRSSVRFQEAILYGEPVWRLDKKFADVKEALIRLYDELEGELTSRMNKEV